MVKDKDILIQQVHQYITAHQLIEPHTSLVVGLSGGPDSIFLLECLLPLQQIMGIKLIGAHLDHEWRPDSEKDVKFCQSVCNTYGIELVVEKISNLSSSLKFEGSKEEYGRRARRMFFESVAKKYKATRIALAHHENDQQETFFIRLIRGAGITGLAGMRAHEGKYIRPLLFLSKQEIVNYLDNHGISYLQDPSNLSREFLRNCIRLDVIPAINACDNRFEKNFSHTITNLQQVDDLLEELAQHMWHEIANEKNQININKLLNLQPILRHRIVLIWLKKAQVTFIPRKKFFEELYRFLSQPGSKTHHIHHTWSIIKNQELAEISQKPQ